MTVDRSVQDVRELEPADTARGPGGLPASKILAMCDRLLDEVGRRRHMFAWLREAGASAGEWLAVDAYYPRARLVVMCRSDLGAHDALFREQIPGHGLSLLMLDPARLGSEPTAVEAAVARRIFDLEHMPRPARSNPAPARSSSRASSTAPSTEPAWTPVKVERTAVAPAVEQGVGMVVGLALALVLIAEVYLDVVYVFGAGRVALAFAVAFDACSRALGTVAAARAGERGWACACAIGGSPVVAWFALLRRSGRVEVEPAPLAGLLALLAGLLGVIGLVVGA